VTRPGTSRAGRHRILAGSELTPYQSVWLHLPRAKACPARSPERTLALYHLALVRKLGLISLRARGHPLTTSDGGTAGCSVGIHLVKNSASSASSASVARRPSTRAWSFASTMAGVVCSSTPACCNADFSCASEMNSPPADRRMFACAATWSGTAGFWSIPVRKEAVNAAIRTEPARAVPSDAPNWLAVFCRPPTSGLTVGHGRDSDAPEL
jgi:hypothetical protein